MAMAASLSLSDILQEVDAKVNASSEPVSYRWLSQHLRAPANLSKRILYEFAKRHESTVDAYYYVSGRMKGGAVLSKIVTSENIEETKKALEEVSSVHVYCVRKKPKEDQSDLSMFYDSLSSLDMKQLRDLFDSSRSSENDSKLRGFCTSCGFVENKSVEHKALKLSFHIEGYSAPKLKRKAERKKSGLQFKPAPKPLDSQEKKQKISPEPSSKKTKKTTGKASKKESKGSGDSSTEPSSMKTDDKPKPKPKPESRPKKVSKPKAGGSRLAMMFKAAASKPKKPKPVVEKLDSSEDEIEELLKEDEASSNSKNNEDAEDFEEPNGKPKKKRKRKSKKKVVDEDEENHVKDSDAPKKKRKSRRKRREILESEDEESEDHEDNGPTLEQLEMYHEVDAVHERMAAAVAAEKAKDLDEENMSEEEAPEAAEFKSFFKKNPKTKKVRKKVERTYIDERGYMVTDEVSEEEEVEIPADKKQDKKISEKKNENEESEQKDIEEAIEVEDEQIADNSEKSEKSSKASEKKKKVDGNKDKKSKTKGKGRKSKKKGKSKTAEEDIDNLDAPESPKEDKKPGKKMKTMFSFFKRK